MDVMRDLATPLPVLVIAQMMGVPAEDRPYVRELAEKLLYIGRGEHDRMPTADRGHAGDDRIRLAAGRRAHRQTRATISSRCWRAARRRASSPGIRCWSTPRCLLLAGHETTINLLCNGTLAFIQHPDQWALLQAGPGRPGQAGDRGVPALRRAGQVDPAARLAGCRDARQGAAQGRSHPLVHLLRQSRSRGVRRTRRRSTSPGSRTRTWPSASGVHHCLGATLARVEGQEVFKALAERFPASGRSTTDGARVSAQHHLPVAEIAAGQPGNRGRRWLASCASG